MFRTIGMWPALAAGLAGAATPLGAWAQAEEGEYEVRVYVDDGQGGGGEKGKIEDHIIRLHGGRPGAFVPGGGGKGGEKREIERLIRRHAPRIAEGAGPGGGRWLMGGDRAMRGFRFDAEGPRGGAPRAGGDDDGPGGCCCPDCPMSKGKAKGMGGGFWSLEGPGGRPGAIRIPDHGGGRPGGGHGEGDGVFEFRIEGPEGGPHGMFFAPEEGGEWREWVERREQRKDRDERAEVRGKVIIVGPDGEKREFDLPGMGGGGVWTPHAPSTPKAPKAPKPPRAPKAPRGGHEPHTFHWQVAPEGGAPGLRWRERSSTEGGPGAEEDVIIELEGLEGMLDLFEIELDPAAETLPPPGAKRVSEPI